MFKWNLDWLFYREQAWWMAWIAHEWPPLRPEVGPPDRKFCVFRLFFNGEQADSRSNSGKRDVTRTSSTDDVDRACVVAAPTGSGSARPEIVRVLAVFRRETSRRVPKWCKRDGYRRPARRRVHQCARSRGRWTGSVTLYWAATLHVTLERSELFRQTRCHWNELDGWRRSRTSDCRSDRKWVRQTGNCACFGGFSPGSEPTGPEVVQARRVSTARAKTPPSVCEKQGPLDRKCNSVLGSDFTCNSWTAGAIPANEMSLERARRMASIAHEWLPLRPEMGPPDRKLCLFRRFFAGERADGSRSGASATGIDGPREDASISVREAGSAGPEVYLCIEQRFDM